MQKLKSSLNLARTTRRRLLSAAGLATVAAAAGDGQLTIASQQRPENIVIDLATEPGTLDPATTYDADGWSVVHSIYDSLLQYGDGGALEPLLAESFELIDSTTYRVGLRPGVSFHNGDPLDVTAIDATFQHLVADETASQVAANFAVIDSIEVIDDLTADLVLSEPAPWLPAQIAAWFAVLPLSLVESGEVGSAPNGTGPYRFVEWRSGDRIVLEANDNYFFESPKGVPVAERVTYRFVPDSTTRVADLLSSNADIVRSVSVDQIGAVESGGAIVERVPISGCAFVRIPTDIEPFSDVRVRQAMNYAIDKEVIVEQLLAGEGIVLPNLFVPNGLGYDSELDPYPYDPDRARELLSQAGYPDGFDTSLDFAATERSDLVMAITSQLSEAGIRTEAKSRELALFNSGDYWLGTDPDASPLRYVTWRPLFDPSTLLNLVISNTGFLSRHDNPEIQELIDAFDSEPDPEARQAIGMNLGRTMTEQPAGIYLYSLTSNIGVAAGTPEWSTREDDYIIATLHE